MGANFVTLHLPGNLDREAVQRQFSLAQEQDRHENGHSYSGSIGMADGIEFPWQQFMTYQDAVHWLEDNCQKWEAAKAVKIKTTDVWLIGAWCAS